jgi:hypothetical protein
VTPRVVLYGAFDRHNAGDLLLAHVSAALIGPRRAVHAGLANRDLRRHGGHRVMALPHVLALQPPGPVDLVHVGGEILACSAWEAAVMLLAPRDVPATVAYLDAHPDERDAWVRRMLGTAARAPYLAPSEWLPPQARVQVLGAGGMDLDRRDPALRREVIQRLHEIGDVGVRDHLTLAHLQAAGIQAHLMPDPAALTAELFGGRIARHAARGEPAQVRAACPGGWIAAQFSADFGDDATLDTLAAQLDAAAAGARCGIVLLRAGAAPWHDDLRVLHRAAARLHTSHVHVATTLDLWDFCALVAGARAYAGSSLHGRIVAMAHGVPRVGLLTAAAHGHPSKQGAYAATWEPDSAPGVVPPQELAQALQQAMHARPAQLKALAHDQAARCRAACARLLAGLPRECPPCADRAADL